MVASGIVYEKGLEDDVPDPDAVPIRDRRVFTEPYDLVIQSLIDQINGKTIFLRPLSDRPSFQRDYVWPNKLASQLIESILLNVPIPPCYLSQNDDYELDVIDGQQRIYSIYRFHENQFALSALEVLQELNGLRFHQLPTNLQRKIRTHTLRCVAITNESHPEIKFDVFERLNTNTTPLNAQELRNCVYRGPLNDLLKDAVSYQPWLDILGRKKPDKRMRDEELILRFFAFNIHGISNYRTPQKSWLNDTAREGRNFSEKRILRLHETWQNMINCSLIWFEPSECFRRPGYKAVNRALFDLIAYSASKTDVYGAKDCRSAFRKKYKALLKDELFQDLISRAIDHRRRTKKRFSIWKNEMADVLQ